jgi:hypothetical protein
LTKEKLSIELFGKTKFYTGLSLGLATTLLFHLFFVYGREILRGTTVFSGDLLIPTHAEFMGYNFFFAAVSITVGFGFTGWFWFHNPFSFRVSRIWNQFIRTYLIAGTLILLVVVLRTGLFTMNLLYGLDGYDNHLSFYYETPELLVLLPTVFFLNVWTPIRLKYRAGNWFWISLGVYLTGTTLLGLSSTIDQSKLNHNWDRSISSYNKIVDAEIKRAALNGINIPEKTIEILRFNKKQRVVDLAQLVKHQFKSQKPISTDKIVIELILVKKSTIRFINSLDSEYLEQSWPFALPRDVNNQMMKNGDSLRTQYLKEIMLEYKEIFKEEQESWELAKTDELNDKYENRWFMRRWYKDIKKEMEKY